MEVCYTVNPVGNGKIIDGSDVMKGSTEEGHIKVHYYE